MNRTVKKSILPNGIRLITQNNPADYSCALGFWVTRGAKHEKPEHNGISHAIEHMLFKGTERRSAFQIAKDLDSVGGVLNAFTSHEYVCYYAKVLDEFIPKAVDLLSDIFLNSSFPEKEVNKELKVVLQEIRMKYDDPESHIHDLFQRHFWQNSPMGRPVIGDDLTVGGFTRELLIKYKNENYTAENIIITAAGKVDHEKLLALISKQFENVKPGNRPSEKIKLPEYRKQLNNEYRDMEQVLLCLGTVSTSQTDPRRFDAYMLNTLLGAGMSSKLFQAIREKHGLAYSIFSYNISYEEGGAFVIHSGTTSDKAEVVIALILKELKELKTELLSTEELASYYNQLKGNTLLALESNDSMMNKIARTEMFFGEYKPVESMLEELANVTPVSLRKFANEIFDEKFFTLEFLGNTKNIRMSVEDLAL
ncbi:MAG: insulinase family protein [Desulfuromonadales bacterium]|nr:insulinase family protein [Desulfuromonadales bacterium]